MTGLPLQCDVLIIEEQLPFQLPIRGWTTSSVLFVVVSMSNYLSPNVISVKASIPVNGMVGRLLLMCGLVVIL